jgi:hypothetical protein
VFNPLKYESGDGLLSKSSWQTKMENLFNIQDQAIAKKPILTPILSPLTIFGTTHQSVNIRLDSSIESFLNKDYPATAPSFKRSGT